MVVLLIALQTKPSIACWCSENDPLPGFGNKPEGDSLKDFGVFPAHSLLYQQVLCFLLPEVMVLKVRHWLVVPLKPLRGRRLQCP